MSVCLSTNSYTLFMSVSLSVCLYVCLSVCRHITSPRLFVNVCLSVSPVCLSVCLTGGGSGGGGTTHRHGWPRHGHGFPRQDSFFTVKRCYKKSQQLQTFQITSCKIYKSSKQLQTCFPSDLKKLKHLTFLTFITRVITSYKS